MLSAPDVLHLEALKLGPVVRVTAPIIATEKRRRIDRQKLTDSEVSGGGVGTNVLPSISCID